MSTAITTMTEQEMGKHFVKSGFFSDAKDESQAIVKILAGREVGLQPIEAMTGINIIKGKISIGANAMAAAVKRHPRYNYKVDEHTSEKCVIGFFENGEHIGTSEFTMEDAKRIGLTSNTNWKNYPKAMLFARAISAGVRYYCPDVFGHSPVYVPEEMGADVDEDGSVIDVTPKPIVGRAKEVTKDIKDNTWTNPEPIIDTDEVDTTTPIQMTHSFLIPEKVIDMEGSVYDAIDDIQGYAMMNDLGAEVSASIIKNCKEYGETDMDINDIPEAKAIKIVKELTGKKFKKVG